MQRFSRASSAKSGKAVGGVLCGSSESHLQVRSSTSRQRSQLSARATHLPLQTVLNSVMDSESDERYSDRPDAYTYDLRKEWAPTDRSELSSKLLLARPADLPLEKVFHVVGRIPDRPPPLPVRKPPPRYPHASLATGGAGTLALSSRDSSPATGRITFPA